MNQPVALIILDGFGLAEPGRGNAVDLARTPAFDHWRNSAPFTSLAASGTDVGLPAGQIGNSEVGHLNLGAGRIVRQSLTHIDHEIETGRFSSNAVIRQALDPGAGHTVHLVGLVSHGGVHSELRHLLALLRTAAELGTQRVAVHVITDGRDTAPDTGLPCVVTLQAALDALPVEAFIASVTGRYWAMDRDQRWERTERAHAAIVCGLGARTARTGATAVQDAYRLGETDEFIQPTVITGADGLPLATFAPGDSVFCFNFRADRMRQLVASLVGGADFSMFERCSVPAVTVSTMMPYADSIPVPAAFTLPSLELPLAEVISRAGLEQFHAAETEKYAHVTYFFNALVETPYPREARTLVQSPRVATYDLQPEMSAAELTEAVLERMATHDDAFILVNFANPDMVGHTGVLEAAVRACEAADHGMGLIVDAVLRKGGVALVVADHGNAEQMLQADGVSPHTAHTTNRVPLSVIGAGDVQLRHDGRLADVAPTVLQLLGLARPAAMTGTSLLLP